MRFDQLVVRIPGDELCIRFHPNLTVLSGLGDEERAALCEGLVAAVAGTSGQTTLRYADITGRPVEVAGADGRGRAHYLDDSSTALPVVGTVVAGEDELRSLMVLRPTDVGLGRDDLEDDDDPELVEARKTLAELTEELEAAVGSRTREERLRAELEEIEAALRKVEEDAARREYAALLEERDRVRAEAAAIRGGTEGREGDEALIASAARVQQVLQAWQEAAAVVATLAGSATTASRLDADTVDKVRHVPDEAPPELPDLIAAVGAARNERSSVEAELRELTAATIAKPTRPEVLDLAAAPQQELWAAGERLQRAEQAVVAEQLALGGSGDHGSVADGVAERIESAQRAVDAAEAAIDRRWKPTLVVSGLLAASSLGAAAVNLLYGPVLLVVAAGFAAVALGLPFQALRAAREVEAEALEAADASSYLGFHLRRVQAVTAPAARHSIDAAEIEHRLALEAWRGLAGDVDAATAFALRNEVIVFAARLATSGGTATEIDDLRRRLVDEVEPSVESAQADLAAAVAPFALDPAALDDLDLLPRLVARQADLGRHARAQAVVERAEEAERRAAADLDDALGALGFADGSVEARVTALEWAVDKAHERQAARAHARPANDVDADLDRLEDEIRRVGRPEWASVEAADARPPDTAELERRRAEVRRKLASPGRPHADAVRLADRRRAMERRVAALEAKRRGAAEEVTIGQLADLNGYLLAHLARASHLGPFQEVLPVVLDEAFVRVAADRKWELLDMLRRLSESNQLVYLTDDPFVAAWARRRASAGLVTLLEPVEAS